MLREPVNIKLICFDLDGVLIGSTKELHFNALNKAIEKVVGKEHIISKEQNDSEYEGLSTRKKLQILKSYKGFTDEQCNLIEEKKQEITVSSLDYLSFDDYLNRRNMIITLREKGYDVVVCTNSIRSTTDFLLEKLRIKDVINDVYTNADVQHVKPHPQIYMTAMVDYNVKPKETLILEDSEVGLQAAKDSGAYVMKINSPDDVSVDKILFGIQCLG